MNDEVEILPCPFCGSNVIYGEQTVSPPTKEKPQGQIMGYVLKHWCDKLPGTNHVYHEVRASSQNAAVRQWNKRK